MTTALDAEIVPMALEVVDLYGQNAVFTVPATKDYDATVGLTTETSPTDHTKKVTPPEPYDKRWVDGDLIQQNDVRIYLPASWLSFTPEKGMLVTLLTTEKFRIVGVKPIYSGEDIAIYDLQLRG